MLLVNAITILLQIKISGRDLETAHLLIMKFTRLTGTLNGQEQMTYNIHILQHVVESVRHWGAPWANSALIYEDAGGLMQRQFHGSKTISLQIFSNIMARARLRQFAS